MEGQEYLNISQTINGACKFHFTGRMAIFVGYDSAWQ